MTNHGISPLIDTLSLGQVRAFLCRKGWKLVEYPNPDLLVFAPSEEDQDDLSVVLPANQQFVDYPARLRDCVRLLANIYDVDPQTIVHNIAHWDRDVLKIRLQSPRESEQLLPLDYASQMISKYRDFVAFAAATEIEPRRFFAKLTGGGRKFVEKCMFGHTFVGSFGLTIECPLDLKPELPFPNVPPPRPFRRAVIERIATGYSDVASSVQNDDPGILVRNHRAGFSGNMCDILADIYEISDGRTISQRIIWAPELHPPEHLVNAERPITLDQRSYDVLKAASEALQTVDEPDEDKVIVGRITRLRSEKPPLNTQEFELASRTIVILWEIEKQQPLHVHIELPLELYRQACDAHKNGKKIRILGKPLKVGKFWSLFDHHDFEVT
jgi:hypothetical protein